VVPMLKRHEVQVLLRAGHGSSEVSRLAGVDLRTVQRIAREAAVSHADDVTARREKRIGRPSKVAGHRDAVRQMLEEDVGLRSVEIFDRLRKAGCLAKRSAVYELVRELRPKPVQLETHFEGLPGEFSQHDFGHVVVTYRDGTKETVTFFASKLKYSRTPLVTIVADETAETLVRALLGHLHAFGGRPMVAVFDRASAIAKKWKKDGTVTQWGRHFQDLVIDLGLGVELCWPYSPEQKGAVENLVGWVKGSFFRQRRFQDPSDLRDQLAAWLHEVTHDRPCRATGVPPAVRLAEEKPRLLPLNITPDQLALRFPVVVGPTASVVFETNRYDVSPELVGLGGTIHAYADRVRIQVGGHEVWYTRRFGRHEHASSHEPRASRLAQVSGQRAKLYRKRQDLFDLGPEVVSYFDAIYQRRPHSWAPDAHRLHALLQDCGDAAFVSAVQASHQAGVFGAEYVAHYLKTAIHLGGSRNLEVHP